MITVSRICVITDGVNVTSSVNLSVLKCTFVMPWLSQNSVKSLTGSAGTSETIVRSFSRCGGTGGS